MTTIAFKDGVMASDSKCTDDGYFTTKCQKIYRLANGALLGTAGDADARALMDLLAKARPSALPSREELAATKTDFKGILAFKNGALFFVYVYVWNFEHDSEWTGQIVELRERFGACGSGEQFAIGAMAAGRTAEQAVAIACRYDSYSGPPIHSVSLREPRRPSRRRQQVSS